MKNFINRKVEKVKEVEEVEEGKQKTLLFS
jgi:hypothetical protein